MPPLPRKFSTARPSRMKLTWRLRSVVRPKLLLSRAYSLLPMRTRVASRMLTTTARTFSRGNPRSPRAGRAHAIELRAVAHLPPFGMVAVLFAAARVAPRRLQMSARLHGDPDVPIGRRGPETGAPPAFLGGR